MNRLISLLCPTRGRPDRVCVMIESVIKTTEKPENVEILFYIDEDDYRKNEYISAIENLLKKYNYPFKRVEPYIGEPMSISKSWNIIAEKCEGDILVMANDDEVWITKGWDKRLNEEADKFHDEIYCIYFDDGGNHGKICCFPMISRKWFETLGYFTPGIFKFIANDAWIQNMAIYIDRLHYVSDVLVEHRHFSFNKSEFDETYKKHRDGNDSNVKQDVNFFNSEACQNKIKEDAKKLMLKMEFNAESFIRLKNRVEDLEKINGDLESVLNRISLFENRQNKIIDALAWWIPIRKWRDNFRNKFLDNFIRGGGKL